jgi:CIC family chloride channel protein
MTLYQDPKIPRPESDQPGSLVVLGLVSLLAGAASGLLGAVFRLTLARADRFRELCIAWAHSEKLIGLLVLIGLGAAAAAAAVAVAAAAWLVRRHFPPASGSGIPHVEAVLAGKLPPAPFRLIPVKFVGGVLAIGAGLALGREGPTVQMGASISYVIGRICRLNWPDCRVLMAAGAGAGLATAFNAPIAGAVFVLEELVRRFETRIAIAALAASAAAIAVARAFLGQSPDFQVAPLPYPGLGTVPVHLALGLIAGFLGVIYNWLIVGGLAAADRLHRWPVELRAGCIGALVGLLAWLNPSLVGGGDAITQHLLSGTGLLGTVSFVFLVRFGLGPLSYASGTPGGLFAPLLVLGAQIGIIFVTLCENFIPVGTANHTAMAIVGMAAFFTAVVRAPVTGIILVIEMTAGFTLLLPMLSACFTAMLVPTIMGNPPIYDSLGAKSRPVAHETQDTP